MNEYYPQNPPPASQRVLTVTELNRLARGILERSFPLFWVSGEISNLTRAASGHWYFSLKDSGAQVRCVMFKGRNSYVDWLLKEGDKVEARALVTLYEARGEFQLTIESLQRAGLGTLFEAFERLKAKLQAEGLFEASRKTSIPNHPRCIGIVTSPDAAALHDVLTTLKRRMPSIAVIIYPSPVQGKDAAQKIAQAIITANQRAECDVLLVCRGGGSIEDLWQFNEEIVARAIFNSAIPIISGVGHETDFTICDFVADQRAATPTAAAEMVSPDRMHLLNQLKQYSTNLRRQMDYLLSKQMQYLDYIAKRVLSPSEQLTHKNSHLHQLQLRLNSNIVRSLQKQQQQLSGLSQNLSHLNPLAVLNRGFAIVENIDKKLITDGAQLSKNDEVEITFAHNAVSATIKKTILSQ